MSVIKEDNIMDENDETDESVISHDSTGKRKSFVRLCERFADKTSLVGVPYINNAKLRTAKVIWSILLFIAMGAMATHLWFLIDQYLQWPVVTKVKLNFATLPFPAITICNTNMMHKERLANYPGAKEMKTLIEKLDPVEEAKRELKALNYTPPIPPTTANPGGWGQWSRWHGVTTKPASEATTPGLQKRRRKRADDSGGESESEGTLSYTNTEQDEFVTEKDKNSQQVQAVRELYMDINKPDREELGHNMGDMMLSCVYNGFVCNPRFFKLHRSSYFGNCWSMDDTIFKVFNSGPQGGLSIILYLESTEYIPGVNQGYGAKMHVHEPNTFSFPNDEGIFIPASMETDIGLKQVSMARKPYPYGTCKDSSDFLKKFGRKFTRTSCQAICKVEYMMEKCGCLSIDLEEVAEAAFPNATVWCRGTKNKTCQEAVDLKFKREKVDCDCDDPCEEVRYEKTISARQWPMEDYAMVLFAGVCKKNMTVCKRLQRYLDEHEGKFNNNFLKLNIFYEQLNFESYEEEAEIEDQQFASDVGGAIGLWIGLSMLSLCEVVQLMFELCDYGRHLLWNKRGKKKTNNARSGETKNVKSDKDSKSFEIPSNSQEGPRKSHLAYRYVDFAPVGDSKQHGNVGRTSLYDQRMESGDPGLNYDNPDHRGHNDQDLNYSGPGLYNRGPDQDHVDSDHALHKSSGGDSDNYSLYYGKQDPRNNIYL